MSEKTFAARLGMKSCGEIWREQRENVAEIKQCVNSFDDLLKACAGLLAARDAQASDGLSSDEMVAAMERARVAIAKATGGKQ